MANNRLDPAAATANALACCVNRWVCDVGNGKVRGEMSMPCGFELVGTVQFCPRAARMWRKDAG